MDTLLVQPTGEFAKAFRACIRSWGVSCPGDFIGRFKSKMCLRERFQCPVKMPHVWTIDPDFCAWIIAEMRLRGYKKFDCWRSGNSVEFAFVNVPKRLNDCGNINSDDDIWESSDTSSDSSDSSDNDNSDSSDNDNSDCDDNDNNNNTDSDNSDSSSSECGNAFTREDNVVCIEDADHPMEDRPDDLLSIENTIIAILNKIQPGIKIVSEYEKSFTTIKPRSNVSVIRFLTDLYAEFHISGPVSRTTTIKGRYVCVETRHKHSYLISEISVI